VFFVDTPPARLAVDDDGDPAAPALVLLHAGNATRRMWDPLAAPLSATHRVVRYDARGFGDSSRPGGRYVGSDDVLAVMDAVGVERATLMGASLGGRVALDTALAAPERVTAVVMIGSVPSGAVPTYTVAEQRLADAADDAEAAADWSRRAELDVDIWSVGPTRRRDQVDPTFLARAVRHAHEHVELLMTTPGASCRAGVPTAVERLGELAAPLLSLVGEHDFAFTRAQQERTVLAVGGEAKAVTIPHAAHFPGVEQPEAVLAVVRPWLAALRA
jgi:pimeloyl-ACP methyl ester carboxylesterase